MANDWPKRSEWSATVAGGSRAPYACTLWIKYGQPVAYVSQPYDLDLATWKKMESWALSCSLEFFVFDKRGWSEPDRSIFVVWRPREDWRSVVPKMKDVPRIPRPPEEGPQLFVERDRARWSDYAREFLD